MRRGASLRSASSPGQGRRAPIESDFRPDGSDAAFCGCGRFVIAEERERPGAHDRARSSSASSDSRDAGRCVADRRGQRALGVAEPGIDRGRTHGHAALRAGALRASGADAGAAGVRAPSRVGGDELAAVRRVDRGSDGRGRRGCAGGARRGPSRADAQPAGSIRTGTTTSEPRMRAARDRPSGDRASSGMTRNWANAPGPPSRQRLNTRL